MSEKRFPIQGGLTVPWTAAERAYETYVRDFGSGQTLERLAERSGFGLHEFVMLYLGHRIRINDRPKERDVSRVLAEVLQND